MLAMRSLKAGEIILREKAAVMGPSMDQSEALFLLCTPVQLECEKNPLHLE